MDSKTPIKVASTHCVACGCLKRQNRNIHYYTGVSKINVSQLLQNYGGIIIQNGKICTDCFRKLENLDKKCKSFYLMCQSNFPKIIKGSKRMASSPSPVKKAAAPIVSKTKVTKWTYLVQKPSTTPKVFRTPSKKQSSASKATTPVSKTMSPTAVFKPANKTSTMPSRKDARRQLLPTEENTTDDFCFITLETDITVGMNVDIQSLEEIDTRASKTLDKIDLEVYSDDVPKKTNKSDAVCDAIPGGEHTYSKNIETKASSEKRKKQKQNIAQPVGHDYLKSVKPKKFNMLYQDMSKYLEKYNDSDEKALYDIRGDTKTICKFVTSNQNLNTCLVKTLSDTHNGVASDMNGRKYDKSILMEKTPIDLKVFSWAPVLEEFKTRFPILYYLVMSLMIKSENQKDQSALESAVPKVGLIYAIMMQNRNQELSLVQRINSAVLHDHICDVKVYDRLHREGVCMGFEGSLYVMEKIGATYKEAIVDLVKENKRFRLVGDNVNWTVDVHDQRLDNRSEMFHAFGSAILVQNIDFSHCSQLPQKNIIDTTVRDFIPSAEDNEVLKFDYIVLMSRVAFKFLPFFKQFEDIVPSRISSAVSESLSKKTKVIPLPVLFKNENKYQDVVEILDYYENIVCDAHDAAGTPIGDKQIHIGGDQLTRERFSGTKRLRGHEDNARNKFRHLSPITFELFHLHMNYLKMAFKILYNAQSGQDIGSLKALQNTISRTHVAENVNTHYDSDKGFFISVVDVHIAEAFMEYFGMEDAQSLPTKHLPPPFNNTDEKKKWYFTEIGSLVYKFVLQNEDEEVIVEEPLMEFDLPNGEKLIVRKKTHNVKKEDGVLNYAKRVLELGLNFKDLLDVTKLPDRPRHISILKNTMLFFKSHNNLSKYAYEILRLLVHQICILSEQSANEQYYGMFVNTNGHVDGHIPADRRMEYLVKKIKNHIKHMYSNKNEDNITNRTSGIAAVAEMCERYDDVSNVIKRTQRHTSKSSSGDEYLLLESLRSVRPFSQTDGRSHAHFRNVHPSALTGLNIEEYHRWIAEKKIEYAFEIGR